MQHSFLSGRIQLENDSTGVLVTVVMSAAEIGCAVQISRCISHQRTPNWLFSVSAIGEGAKRVKHILGPTLALRRQLKDHPTSRATALAAPLSRAVQVSFRIRNQDRSGTAAVRPTSEAVEHGFFAGSIQLEYRSLAVRAASVSHAINVA